MVFLKGLAYKARNNRKSWGKAEKSENDAGNGTESGEISASSSVPTPDGATTITDNKNASSVQNADQSAREVNQEDAKITGKEKPNFAPPPGETKTVNSGTVNPNQGKN